MGTCCQRPKGYSNYRFKKNLEAKVVYECDYNVADLQNYIFSVTFTKQLQKMSETLKEA